MGRLRASLRAYAVMEGEDPVAVLSDLELLLRLTEPARAATALFGYAEPELRKVLLAGAGHCPPLVVGDRRVEFLSEVGVPPAEGWGWGHLPKEALGEAGPTTRTRRRARTMTARGQECVAADGPWPDGGYAESASRIC